MFRLASLIYSIAGATLAGIAIIAVLVAGMVTTKAIVGAAVAGFVLALPIAWIVAKKIDAMK